MIVKNEETCLSSCLESVCGLAQEIIIVDTGSTDRTKDIARRFKVSIYDMEWGNDFSKARNFSIQKATMDWILVLDADEVISLNDHEKIRNLLSSNTYHGFSLEQRTYGLNPGFMNWNRTTGEYPVEEKAYPGFVCSPLIRLFRNEPRIVFQGVVHELVEPSFLKHRVPWQKTNIPIHHYGKIREPSRIRDKANLYLKIGRKKLKIHPNNAKAIAELGAQHIELGDYLSAADVFQKAIRLQPDHADYFVNLGVCHLRLGKLGESENNLKKALSLRPRHLDAHLNLGTVYLHQCRYEDAEAEFITTLEIDPNFGLAYGSIGSSLLCRNRIEESIPYLLMAVNLNAGDADACSNLAYGCIKLSWPHFALTWAQKALEINPNHQNASQIRNAAETMSKRPLDEAGAHALTNEGENWFSKGFIEPARTSFQKAGELNPYDAKVWNNIGVVYWNTDEKERALGYFIRACLLSADDFNINDNLALACADLEENRLKSILDRLAKTAS